MRKAIRKCFCALLVMANKIHFKFAKSAMTDKTHFEFAKFNKDKLKITKFGKDGQKRTLNLRQIN